MLPFVLLCRVSFYCIIKLREASEKMVGQENYFNSSDLLKYAETLIKETKHQETKYLDQSNYGWLRDRHLQGDDVIEELELLKPMIEKMTPESCTSVAVKLDLLTEEMTSTTAILVTLKKLLEEEDSLTLLAGVKKGKEKRMRTNRVKPVLTPPGRKAVVSFILEVDY